MTQPPNTDSVSPRHPDEILMDFDAGCQGQVEIDMRGLLWEVIEDVRSSYRLAIAGACGDFMEYTDATLNEIENTITDYLVNNYGDD